MLDQCLCLIEVGLYLSSKRLNMATGRCEYAVLFYSLVDMELQITDYPHLHLLYV